MKHVNGNQLRLTEGLEREMRVEEFLLTVLLLLFLLKNYEIHVREFHKRHVVT